MSAEVLLQQALREGRFSTSETGEGDKQTSATLLARLVGLQDVDLAPWESLEHAVLRPGPLLLSQQEANLLYFCDQIFEQCHSQTDLEPALLDAFMALRPLIASVFLRDPSVLGSMHHPLFSLLDQLWDAGRYWGADLGKPGDKYRARLDEMLLRIRKADPLAAPFQTWLEELSGQLAKDAQRAETLIDRIRQTARGTLAGEQAERFVRQEVSKLLERAPMPDVVEELLKGPLRHSMKVIYLSRGGESDEWKQISRAAQLLIDSMQAIDAEADMQQVYQTIPKVLPLLSRQLVSISDAAEMESWLSRVEKLHMQILLGGKLELRPAQPLSVLNEEAGVNANISSSLLEQVKLIPEGQWLIYQRDDGEKLRCRLVLKTEEAGQLLFVNVLGAKSLEKTPEEFAYLLAARHVRLLDADNNFSQIMRDTVANFLQLYQRQALLLTEATERQRIENERRRLGQEKAKREAERIAQERLEAQARAEEEARQQLERHAKAEQEKARKAEEEAQRLAQEAQKAADQAKTHALAQAAQKAAAEAERALLAEKQARIDEWEVALQSTRTLGIGAWVDIEINGECQRCKLAAVINASDKLIFVGRDGKKLIEPKRDELIKLMIDGKASVIQQGDQFENSLAKVIQTLRKD
ncbi:MAG TPA: DUF1631 family protein [Pseudomonadales bacterium]|nr:DUF1631 family protein [Pseudomonadales bacterium]